MNSDNTITLVSMALDAALMRQTAIASNIAHANIKNHQTLRVDFEKQLTDSFIDTKDIKPTFQLDDTPSSIDEQMALSVKNAMQYRALIKGLNHKLAIMKLAVEGNNAS